MQESRKAARLRLGLIVLIGLIILSGLEFGLAASLRTGIVPVLAVIALIKAGLILQYFMHLSQLWRVEEHR